MDEKLIVGMNDREHRKNSKLIKTSEQKVYCRELDQIDDHLMIEIRSRDHTHALVEKLQDWSFLAAQSQHDQKSNKCANGARVTDPKTVR